MWSVRLRASYPLAVYIRSFLAGSAHEGSSTIEFPAGRSYRIEASKPSRRRLGGVVLLLFLEPLDDNGPRPVSLDPWLFTAREEDVARHLMSGATSEDICRVLGFGPETLKSHLGNMFKKTGTKNRAELVAKLLAG